MHAVSHTLCRVALPGHVVSDTSGDDGVVDRDRSTNIEQPSREWRHVCTPTNAKCLHERWRLICAQLKEERGALPPLTSACNCEDSPIFEFHDVGQGWAAFSKWHMVRIHRNDISGTHDEAAQR